MPVSVISNASFGNDSIVTANGIKFPATQSASTDANTLDDYEEGTWTPTGNGISFTSASGTYTKVGRIVTVTCVGRFPVTSNTSEARFNGLPFTSGVDSAGAIGYVNTSLSNSIFANINSGQTHIGLFSISGGAFTNANMSNSFFTISATYAV